MRLIHASRTYGLVAGGVALLLVLACRKEQQTTVPVTPVDFTINVNNPGYADIQVPGGWIYLTGGSAGIIVYRKTTDEFVALDRLCTYQTQTSCRVHVDESQVMAKDTVCCGSAFLLIDGTVTEGPAQIGLVRYNTSFNGSLLRIWN